MHRIAGKIALKSVAPNTENAEKHFERALGVARQQQAKSWELRAAMSLARLWRDQGKVQQARELLAVPDRLYSLRLPSPLDPQAGCRVSAHSGHDPQASGRRKRTIHQAFDKFASDRVGQCAEAEELPKSRTTN